MAQLAALAAVQVILAQAVQQQVVKVLQVATGRELLSVQAVVVAQAQLVLQAAVLVALLHKAA
jgi:hypothetical protein